LPEGQHLLQAIASSRYRGAIVLIDMEPNADRRLGALQSQVGGRIRGTVMVESAQGSELPASRVAVYAIPGGAQAVAAGGPIIDLPPEGTHYVSFTDGAGQFSLDALAPGDYLVTAAVAGCATDAQLVAQLGERQTVSGVDLTLAAGGESTGTVRGTVRGQIGGGTQSLPGAIVRAELTVRLAPTVPEETIDRIAAQAGTPLRPSPWFRWQVLSTLTDAGGSYTLSLPVGTGRITCFTYDYRPAYQDVTISTGADTHASFTLQAR
ncbi:MAG: carboxypeptidase-like regulatory domain-containing protein, partial [Armatimonadota bacterium]